MNEANFEKTTPEKHHYLKNVLIVLFIVIIIIGVWYYLNIQPTKENTQPIKDIPKSLVNDENYVQEKMNEYLENNPNADEDYARDAVYLNIAREQKNPEICDKIKDSELKYFCSNAAR